MSDENGRVQRGPSGYERLEWDEARQAYRLIPVVGINGRWVDADKSLLRQYELVMTQEDHEIVRPGPRRARRAASAGAGLPSGTKAASSTVATTSPRRSPTRSATPGA